MIRIFTTVIIYIRELINQGSTLGVEVWNGVSVYA